MTTIRRPIRGVGALVAAGAVAALALGGCTPSGLDLETRTTRSAYRDLNGRTATGDTTCSLERVGDGPSGDEYRGSCVVNGQSFRMTAFYDQPSSSYGTAFTSAAVPLGGDRLYRYTCLWAKSGSEPWTLTSPCSGGVGPGF